MRAREERLPPGVYVLSRTPSEIHFKQPATAQGMPSRRQAHVVARRYERLGWTAGVVIVARKEVRS